MLRKGCFDLVIGALARTMVPTPSQWNVSLKVIGGRWTRSVATLKPPGAVVIASSCVPWRVHSARRCLCRTHMCLMVAASAALTYPEVL
jgi:hypothetical protein